MPIPKNAHQRHTRRVCNLCDLTAIFEDGTRGESAIFAMFCAVFEDCMGRRLSKIARAVGLQFSPSSCHLRRLYWSRAIERTGSPSCLRRTFSPEPRFRSAPSMPRPAPLIRRRGYLRRAIFRCRSRDGAVSGVDCPKPFRRLEIDDEARRISARKRQKAPFR
jgi:hypothetical protein